MALMVGKGGGALGGLGTLLGIGGALTGNPWLTAAGMGANALSGNGSGGVTQSGLDAISQIAEQMGWKNPATGNVASQSPELDKIQAASDEEWARRYLRDHFYSGLNSGFVF